MDACLGRVPPTDLSLVLICLNVLAFPGAKEPRNDTVCGYECNISFRLTGLPRVWPLYECIPFLAISAHLRSLQEPV